jgi:hypothetical protein
MLVGLHGRGKELLDGDAPARFDRVVILGWVGGRRTVDSIEIGLDVLVGACDAERVPPLRLLLVEVGDVEALFLLIKALI